MSIFITVIARAGLSLVVNQSSVAANSDPCRNGGMKLDFHFNCPSMNVPEQHRSDSLDFSIVGEFLNGLWWKAIRQMGNGKPTVIVDRTDGQWMTSEGQTSITNILKDFGGGTPNPQTVSTDKLNAGKVLFGWIELTTEFIPNFGSPYLGFVLQRQFRDIDICTSIGKRDGSSSRNWKALRRATTNGTVTSHDCCKGCGTLGVSSHTRRRVGVLRADL